MDARHYLDDVLRQLAKYRGLAERAISQVTDDDLFRTIDPESNSIAIVMKHVAGNMRSRWTDFLTTDGDKPGRDRDAEFELDRSDTKARVLERWHAGWNLTVETIGALQPADLERIVTIRGEPHTVIEAVNRQLVHYAYHVGQIVLLARHFAGARWESLSIPRGKSREYDVSKDGRTYDAGGR
jgi:hypothetical protein